MSCQKSATIPSLAATPLFTASLPEVGASPHSCQWISGSPPQLQEGHTQSSNNHPTCSAGSFLQQLPPALPSANGSEKSASRTRKSGQTEQKSQQTHTAHRLCYKSFSLVPPLSTSPSYFTACEILLKKIDIPVALPLYSHLYFTSLSFTWRKSLTKHS